MRCSNNKKTSWLILIFSILILILMLTGCKGNNNALGSQAEEKSGQTIETSSVELGVPSEQAQETKGDGNLTFNVTINEAAEKAMGQAIDQETATKAGAVKTIRFIDAEPPQYLLAFTVADALGRLQLIPPEIRYSAKVVPGTPLVVNSAAFFNQLSHDGLVHPLKVQVVVVREEDPFMRNPLCEPLELSFPDDKTCNEGYDFNLSIKDESLTSIFEAGSLVIRLVGTPEQFQLGPYLNLIYQKPNVELPFNYGRGISGGDYIIELTTAQMMNEGIEYGTMSIIDYNNNAISDSILLHFDTTGSCIEGRFIEFTLKDPVK